MLARIIKCCRAPAVTSMKHPPLESHCQIRTSPSPRHTHRPSAYDHDIHRRIKNEMEGKGREGKAKCKDLTTDSRLSPVGGLWGGVPRYEKGRWVG